MKRLGCVLVGITIIFAGAVSGCILAFALQGLHISQVGTVMASSIGLVACAALYVIALQAGKEL